MMYVLMYDGVVRPVATQDEEAVATCASLPELKDNTIYFFAEGI